MPRRNWNKVFVTGGTGFIGRHVVAMLVEAGADVTVLVDPEHEDQLGTLRRHIHMVSGDVWNSASLKGRSRNHGVVVHLVGSVRAQPEKGLTFQQLNLVSARNVISMAVSDGVPYFVLLSAASRPPGVSSEYLRSKRDAEQYLRSSGLQWAIVRAPVVFDREQGGGAFFALLSRIGSLPLLRIFWGRRTPLPVDVAARGLARIALQEDLPHQSIIYADQLRRLGRVKTRRVRGIQLPRRRGRAESSDGGGEEVPFGWLPGAPRDED